MRDYRKLRTFELADELVLEVYRATTTFPRHEQFGLISQMRRAATSMACNIVEGCARTTEADYLRFLDISYGSARELEYQISLALRLGYMQDADYQRLAKMCDETCRVINGLIRSLRVRAPASSLQSPVS